jgi:hypothetical protein
MVCAIPRPASAGGRSYGPSNRDVDAARNAFECQFEEASRSRGEGSRPVREDDTAGDRRARSGRDRAEPGRLAGKRIGDQRGSSARQFPQQRPAVVADGWGRAHWRLRPLTGARSRSLPSII